MNNTKNRSKPACFRHTAEDNKPALKQDVLFSLSVGFRATANVAKTIQRTDEKVLVYSSLFQFRTTALAFVSNFCL